MAWQYKDKDITLYSNLWQDNTKTSPCIIIYDMAPLAKERMKASVVRKVAAVAVSWHGNDDGHDGHHGVGDGDQDDYVGDKRHPSAISRQDDSSIQLLPSIVEAACAFS